MLEIEIKDSHKKIHDDLTEDYYKKKLMSKEDFNYYHGQNWADMETELIAEGYIKPPEPVRDLATRVSELEAKIAVLEKR